MTDHGGSEVPGRPTPLLSIVVVAWEMARELPRTLETLSPRMQRGVAHTPYEVIVVDNGSEPAMTVPDEPWLSLLRVEDGGRSPARAVNAGLGRAAAELVGVVVDGARMASPGLVRHALLARRLHERPVIGTLSFHLGPDLQQRSMQDGYGAAREDELLASVDWRSDGYRLFDVSVLAASSAGGWFQPAAESNALFLPRSMWQELGGFDERFVSPGGGFVNLDAYARAWALPRSQPVILLGEGTFHQFHGGVSTNVSRPPTRAFQEEYEAIRGAPFRAPWGAPIHLGTLDVRALPWVGRSVTAAVGAQEG